MLKYADGEGKKKGEVYEKIDSIISEISDVINHNKHHDDYEKMKEIMVYRWEKMKMHMHCLGFALNPFFHDINYLNSPAPGGEPKRPPNCDTEVVNGVLKAFDMVGEDDEEKRVSLLHLAKFQAKEGIFSKRTMPFLCSTRTMSQSKRNSCLFCGPCLLINSI